jgi:fucose permease
VSVTLIGATVPAILRDLGWRYLTMGTVLAAGSVAYLTSTFLCGLLVRRLGPRPVIAGGLVLQALGVAAFGTSPKVALNILAMCVIGLGEGGTEIVSNYSVVRIERSGQSRIMNLMHSAFTIGAVAGPLAVGSLLQQGLAWRTMYLAVALCSVISAVAFALVSFGDAGQRQEVESSTRSAVAALARRPMLALFALAILLYIGAEIGVTNWLAEYYVEVHGYSMASAATSVSVFWGGLLCGRVLAWAAYHGHRQDRFLVVLTGTAALGTGLALVSSAPWLSLAMFFVGGLGFSAVYPVVMTLTGLRYPQEQSVAIGVVAAAGGLGSLIFPYAMSGIAERYGIVQGFWFYEGLAAAMAVTALAILVLGSRRQRGEGAPGRTR